jgi:hypothetical protein
MPILESVFFGFLGGLVANSSKALSDSFWNGECIIRRSIKMSMNAIDNNTITLDEKHVVDNSQIIDEMHRAISGGHGIFVCGVPPGSGKSTYMKLLMEKLSKSDVGMSIRLIRNGTTAIQERKLHSLLRIPESRCLSEFLPPNSLIIIDQFDVKLTEDLKEGIRNYIVELATDSANSKQFKIIFCVSDARLEKAILKSNGFEKIRRLIQDRHSFEWTEIQINQYIGNNLNYLCDEDVEFLKKLGSSCKNSPGLFHLAFTLTQESQGERLSTHTRSQLDEYATSSRATWQDFESSNLKTT